MNAQGDVMGIIGVIYDITEQKNLEIKQRNLNRIDVLTGLYNRLRYEERLQDILSVDNLPLSIIVGDTNQLKAINDNYGHLMGDNLLKATASIIKISVGLSGEIYRIGGDEFVIFLPRTDENKALDIIYQIRCMELKCNAFPFRVKTSLGYAAVESITDNSVEKISDAERIMYIEKRNSYNS